jgi:DNA-binding IclR family transcriptional regulator
MRRELSARKLARPETAPADKDTSLSIVKASAILREIGATKEGRTLTEIVGATGISTTVCFRMLATLERERFVDKDGSTGRYRLGFGLVALARHTLHQQVIGPLTARMMVDAARELSDVALLMVPDGERALCVDRKEGDAPIITLGTHVGSRPLLHCGGGPFAILAFSPDDFIDEYLARPLERVTPRSVVDPKRIRARIQEARARGYTVGDEDLYEHVVAIGVPIFGPTGTLLGSISVGGVKPRYTDKRIKEVGEWLLKAARALR